jgi:hypothetical protein
MSNSRRLRLGYLGIGNTNESKRSVTEEKYRKVGVEVDVFKPAPVSCD